MRPIFEEAYLAFVCKREVTGGRSQGRDLQSRDVQSRGFFRKKPGISRRMPAVFFEKNTVDSSRIVVNLQAKIILRTCRKTAGGTADGDGGRRGWVAAAWRTFLNQERAADWTDPSWLRVQLRGRGWSAASQALALSSASPLC